MNPNARSFAFNPSAQGFAPQQGQQFQGNGQQQPYDPNAQYYQQAYQQGGGYYQGGFAQPQQQQGYYQGGFQQPQQQQPQEFQGQPYQQQQQQQSRPPPAGSGLPPRPGQVANGDAPARKPVSLSIGGGSSSAPSSSATARKPVSISIGGAKKDSPAATPPPAADKKPVSISIGGSAAPAAAATAAASDATTATAPKEDKVSPPADIDQAANAEPAPPAAVSKVKAEESAPADAAAPSAPSAASTPRSESPVQGTVSKGGKSGKQSAKIDAKVEKSATDVEKVLAEAKQATDEETLKDLFGDKAEDLKAHLNVVFIGHVDAGKSTMGGQLLYLTGQVDKRTLEKFEKEAKEAGRESWYLSWALDSTPQEREKGKTVECGRAYFETGKRRYTILDAPGHKTYVPSMISGAAQADVAILVISARRGEFETGFEKGGQTREHAMLVKTAGVQRLVVVVNKMDESTVQWEEDRYNEVVTKLTPFLRSAGFNTKTDVAFVPVSAYAGQNLKEPVSKDVCSWYKGPSLLEYLDNLSLNDRKISEPLKMPISEKYSDMGTLIVGKLEAGKMRKGDSLLLMPNKTNVEVVAIYNEQEEEVPAAVSGDNVRVKLKGVDVEDVSNGYVLTDPRAPVHAVTQFEAQLAILDSKNIIAPGYTAVIHCHTVSEEISIKALLHYYDKKTGKKSRKPPTFAKKGMKVGVLIETAAPICLERFKDIPSLGRFTVRDEGYTVGIGKTTKLHETPVDLEKLNISG